MPVSLADVDLAQLSERALQTLQTIAIPMSEGSTIDNLVDELGLTRKQLDVRLNELASEMQNQTGGPALPKLSPIEYEALRDSIAAHGQLYPIIRDRAGFLVDGANRERACKELGVEPIVKYLPDSLNADELRVLAFVANVARRQLTASARRGIALAELVRDPTRSDREIARRVGMSHTWVAELRRGLEESGDVASVATRTDSVGRQQPVQRRRENLATPPATQLSVTCPSCGHEFDPKEGR